MTEIDFRTTPLAELTRSVRSKEVSAPERPRPPSTASTAESTYNAFVAVDDERALAEADDLDRRIATGADPGPLAGIPLGVKDLQSAIGYTTTHGSALYADDPPATADDPSSAACGPRAVSSSARPTHPSSAGWATPPTASSAPH